MDVVVSHGQGLPEKAYLSIRVGEQRKQALFKPGETFTFEPRNGNAFPRHFVVDVFEKVGSKQVSLSDLEEQARRKAEAAGIDVQKSIAVDGEEVPERNGIINISNRRGSQIRLDLEVKTSDPKAIPARRQSRHQAALQAKDYIEGQGVQRVLQEVVRALIAAQPEDPMQFMSDFLLQNKDMMNAQSPKAAKSPKHVRTSMSPKASRAGKTIKTEDAATPATKTEDAAIPSIKTEDAASPSPKAERASEPIVIIGSPAGVDDTGFPADGSAELPDLSLHHSLAADVLREMPGMYAAIREACTPKGVKLARCIKPAVDVRGHQLLRLPGLCAGDERCFDVFASIFNLVTERWHGSLPLEGYKHLQGPIELGGLSTEPVDPSGRHVLSVKVVGHRNLSGLRFAPSLDDEERAEVEQVLVTALGSAATTCPALAGCVYYPLPAAAQAPAQVQKFFPMAPDSDLQRVFGFSRNWPQSRGVFVPSASGPMRSTTAFVNEAHHLRIECNQESADFAGALDGFVSADAAIEAGLASQGHRYAFSGRLGFLGPCIPDVGTGLILKATLRLPNVSCEPDFKVRCQALGLKAVRKSGEARAPADLEVWEVSDCKPLGVTPVEQANRFMEGCRELVALELAISGAQDPFTEEAGAKEAGAREEEEEEEEEDDEENEEPHPEGFPVDECPETMPDLTGHCSLTAKLLQEHPILYANLREGRTAFGTTFAQCVKPCFDVKGHKMIRTLGCVAGDADCYEAFSLFFDPLIEQRHPGWKFSDGPFPVDMDPTQVQDAELDLSELVCSVRLKFNRSLAGFRMPPACDQEERRDVERLVVAALSTLDGEFAGEYFPLRGSASGIDGSRPEGMSIAEEEKLREAGHHAEDPDCGVRLAAGYARNWPDARGVFVSAHGLFRVTVNGDDHISMVMNCPGSDLLLPFVRTCILHERLRVALAAAGAGFACSERLGYLTSSPGMLGTALEVVANIGVDFPAEIIDELRSACKDNTLALRAKVGPGDGCWQLTSGSYQVGLSAAHQISWMMGAFNWLMSRSGMGVRILQRCPSGLGEEDCPGFPADECPEFLPDLSEHYNLMAQVLREYPGIYHSLRCLNTTSGTSLARCIKTGIDNPGHPMIRTTGIVAGDADCYEFFAPLFDKVIAILHPNYKPAKGHRRDLDHTKVSNALREQPGSRVISVCISACRNVQGFPLPPAASLQDRIEVERLLMSAFHEMPQELAGDYFPLPGSDTCPTRPEGMSPEEAAWLKSQDLLLEEPDSKLQISSGMARFWPKARGVFVAQDDRLAAWVNEDNHLQLVSIQHGSDVAAAFGRFCKAALSVEKSLKAKSGEFAWSDKLGYLSTCPSNLGTGLRVQALVKLPLLGATGESFKSLAKRFNVNVRIAMHMGYGEHSPIREGLWEVSNVDKLGSTEVSQVNGVIYAVQSFVAIEEQLESGGEVDLESMQPGSSSILAPSVPPSPANHDEESVDQVKAVKCAAREALVYAASGDGETWKRAMSGKADGAILIAKTEARKALEGANMDELRRAFSESMAQESPTAKGRLVNEAPSSACPAMSMT